MKVTPKKALGQHFLKDLNIAQRIAEAEKLGFRRFLLPEANMKSIDPKQYNIELVPVARVEHALRELFG